MANFKLKPIFLRIELFRKEYSWKMKAYVSFLEFINHLPVVGEHLLKIFLTLKPILVPMELH